MLLATDDDTTYAADFERLIATSSKPGRPFADHAWQIATRFVSLLHRMSAAIAIERAMIDAAAGKVIEGEDIDSFRELATWVGEAWVDPVLRGSFAMELERALIFAAATKQESELPSEEEAQIWKRNPASAAQHER